MPNWRSWTASPGVLYFGPSANCRRELSRGPVRWRPLSPRPTRRDYRLGRPAVGSRSIPAALQREPVRQGLAEQYPSGSHRGTAYRRSTRRPAPGPPPGPGSGWCSHPGAAAVLYWREPVVREPRRTTDAVAAALPLPCLRRTGLRARPLHLIDGGVTENGALIEEVTFTHGCAPWPASPSMHSTSSGSI